MKQIILFFSLYFSFTGLVSNLSAQEPTDSRGEYGIWSYATTNYKFEHFQPGVKFPPANIEGKISKDIDGTKSFKVSQAVQNKMQALLQVFKDAYPKPYRESAIFSMRYINENTNDIPFSYKMILGKNDFGYTPKGKIISGQASKWNGYASEGYGTVNVNCLSTGTNSNYFIGNLFTVFEELSYYSKKTEAGNFVERPEGIIYADGPQNYLEENVKNWKNPPPFVFNNIADNYFSKRNITGVITDGTENYQIKNYVLLTYNNKLPFIALTINDFFNSLDEYFKDYVTNKLDLLKKYNSKDQNYDEKVKQTKAELLAFKNNLQELREINKNKLSKPAILKALNSFIPNRKRDGKLEDIFIEDPKKGWKLYKKDKDYYTGAKEDEIRTISIEWLEQVKVPLNEKFPDENAKDKNGNLLTDVRFHSAMQYKFNWTKLTSLLSK
jgi:hypothetical protein